MTKSDSALITGISGELGQAIANVMVSNDIKVYGIDKVVCEGICDQFYRIDLLDFVNKTEHRHDFISDFRLWATNTNFKYLINNAAYQYVSGGQPVPLDEFNKSIDINFLAPYYLTTELSDILEENSGMVLNISSIHAKLTKKDFISYSTTKAALTSLTKSLALIYGGKFQVNCLEPAAIETRMLKSGFSGNLSKIEDLVSYHPTQSIATPKEMAEFIYAICKMNGKFLNGSVIDISGGISGRLHDPD